MRRGVVIGLDAYGRECWVEPRAKQASANVIVCPLAFSDGLVARVAIHRRIVVSARLTKRTPAMGAGSTFEGVARASAWMRAMLTTW